MNKSYDELEEEVKILTERVKILEKKERHRNTMKLIKTLIWLVILGGIAFTIWRGYNYITDELPKDINSYISDKVNDLNPFNKNS